MMINGRRRVFEMQEWTRGGALGWRQGRLQKKKILERMELLGYRKKYFSRNFALLWIRIHITTINTVFDLMK